MPVKYLRLKIIFVILIFDICIFNFSYAAPCYGTRLPEKNKFSTGVESYTIFKRYLRDDYGKLRSSQYFLLLSYGVFDWLSIDLKGGAGNIRQSPLYGDSARYPTGFAGGYGFRLKFYDDKKIKMVFGFQHISVHPQSKHIGSVKNSAILDDWQGSLLVSYDFNRFSPYLGTKYSRADYIHKADGEDKKHIKSDRTKSVGLIVGLNLSLTEKSWINIEGQFLDSEALAFSLNYGF